LGECKDYRVVKEFKNYWLGKNVYKNWRKICVLHQCKNRVTRGTRWISYFQLFWYHSVNYGRNKTVIFVFEVTWHSEVEIINFWVSSYLSSWAPKSRKKKRTEKNFLMRDLIDRKVKRIYAHFNHAKIFLGQKNH
jgi:hypothetical protein